MSNQKILIVGNLGRGPTAEAQTVTVGGVTSPVIKIDGRALATTRQLAAFFGCDERNITDNFGNHKFRFRDGVHFIRLSGDALRTFKQGLPDEIGEPMKYAPKVILWTERGAARHAKALTTEAAWSIFEALEDSYFRSQPAPMPAPAIAYTVSSRDTLTKAEQDQLRDALYAGANALPSEQQGAFLIRGWSKLKSHFKTGHYREIPRREFVEALSIIKRHVVEYQPAAPASQHVAIGHAINLQATIEGFASIASGLALMMPGLVAVLRDANGVHALTEPPARLTVKPASNASGTVKRKRA